MRRTGTQHREKYKTTKLMQSWVKLGKKKSRSAEFKSGFPKLSAALTDDESLKVVFIGKKNHTTTCTAAVTG